MFSNFWMNDVQVTRHLIHVIDTQKLFVILRVQKYYMKHWKIVIEIMVDLLPPSEEKTLYT